MTTTFETIKSFFGNFPYKKKIQSQSIDYNFFESLIPIILSARRNQSLNPPKLNIFDGFNIGKNELRHCSLLAWFFNPGGNHSQGELFLNCFLKKFDVKDILPYTENRYFTVSLEDSYAEQGRVDISIYNKYFWIIIEAKILATEQVDQIERYSEILRKKSSALGIPRQRCKLFFLTDDGRKPISGEADFNIRWKDMAEVLKNFATCCKNDYVLSTAKQYSNFIISYLGENHV